MSKEPMEWHGGTSTSAQARKVRALVDARVKKAKSPASIRKVEVRFGEDSTGDPAVWVSLVVDSDDSPSNEKILALTRVVKLVQSDLLKARLPYFPYVDVKAAA